MRFPIPVRNAQTGEEKNFFDKQEIADFLATTENPADWEGWSHLGDLPAATEPVTVEEPQAPAEVEPVAPVADPEPTEPPAEQP